MASSAVSLKKIPVSPVVRAGNSPPEFGPTSPDSASASVSDRLGPIGQEGIAGSLQLHVCHLHLPEGCYQLRINSDPPVRSSHGFGGNFQLGSLRVGKAGENYAISGDTYRYSWLDHYFGSTIPFFGPTTIPIYPRNRYQSYLKVTAVNIPLVSSRVCKIHLQVEEYDYTQPPAGTYDGVFAATASRVMEIHLTPTVPPAGFTGAYFTGEISIGGVLQANMGMTLAWVSPMFRRATVELHTMTGAVAPAAIPTGSGSEFIDSIYAKAKWQMTVLTDPHPVPVPVTTPPTIPTNDWSNAALHAVMTALSDYAAINLDASWHMHVLIVQARLGSGRGAMFDIINVPREGVASYCDDGYPQDDSPWFGTAANQHQRLVPRAFLRSCTHEITHGFNQIHQEEEDGADNSIMTTTPSVAEVIHTAGGTFPDDINLDFNDHVRHHLRHLPDPIVRPGGMSFYAGHNGIPVPSEDEEAQSGFVAHPSISLQLNAQKSRLKIGEPLRLSWAMKNSGQARVTAPNYVGIEHDFAELSVLKPDGTAMDVAPFVIVCDAGQLTDLKPGETRRAEYDLFWSTQGFAFEAPGKHTVELTISWNLGDRKVGASATVEILVDYPVSAKDNDVIAHMMNPEVGKFIALGGHAYHLREAVARIGAVMHENPSHDVGKRMAAFFDEKRASASLGDGAPEAPGIGKRVLTAAVP